MGGRTRARTKICSIMVPSMRRSIALLLLALVACELLAEAQAQLTHSAVNHPRPPVSHPLPLAGACHTGRRLPPDCNNRSLPAHTSVFLPCSCPFRLISSIFLSSGAGFKVLSFVLSQISIDAMYVFIDAA